MNKSRLLILIVLGVVFWFIAAMIIRTFGANVFTQNNPRLILFFILAIPLTVLSMYLTVIIARLRFDELLKPVVIMTFTATFLDGIALAWFRQLYSASFEVALNGAAWILWGAGLGLLFSFCLDTIGKRSEDEQLKLPQTIMRRRIKNNPYE